MKIKIKRWKRTPPHTHKLTFFLLILLAGVASEFGTCFEEDQSPQSPVKVSFKNH